MTIVRAQPSNDEIDKSENTVDPLRIQPESISGRLRNRTPRSNATVENESDTEDDKPLQNLITVHESPRSRPIRVSSRYSDDHVTQSQTASATSSTRSGRTHKRPHYNEDTDEEDNHRTKRQATQGRYVSIAKKFLYKCDY